MCVGESAGVVGAGGIDGIPAGGMAIVIGFNVGRAGADGVLRVEQPGAIDLRIFPDAPRGRDQ